MKVNEIFYSLQGEGTLSGEPTVFVRLQGCNLNCSYCDTRYAQKMQEGEEWSIEKIIGRIESLASDDTWVCFTGGEPLLQESELEQIVPVIYNPVTIETNGTLPRPKWASLTNSWNIDVKCPSANVDNFLHNSWKTGLEKEDQ